MRRTVLDGRPAVDDDAMAFAAERMRARRSAIDAVNAGDEPSSPV